MISERTQAATLKLKTHEAISGFTAIGQTLYVITNTGNTFRSTNYGGSWQRREISQTRRFAKVGDEEAVWVDM